MIGLCWSQRAGFWASIPQRVAWTPHLSQAPLKTAFGANGLGGCELLDSGLGEDADFSRHCGGRGDGHITGFVGAGSKFNSWNRRKHFRNKSLTFELLCLQKGLQHLTELLVREWFSGVIVGTVRARPFLVDLAVVAGNVEQRVS